VRGDVELFQSNQACWDALQGCAADVTCRFRYGRKPVALGGRGTAEIFRRRRLDHAVGHAPQCWLRHSTQIAAALSQVITVSAACTNAPSAPQVPACRFMGTQLRVVLCLQSGAALLSTLLTGSQPGATVVSHNKHWSQRPAHFDERSGSIKLRSGVVDGR
jgi:hypothetical protein